MENFRVMDERCGDVTGDGQRWEVRSVEMKRGSRFEAESAERFVDVSKVNIE